jgi:hypothetical protein
MSSSPDLILWVIVAVVVAIVIFIIDQMDPFE